jgi:hypothetical protein
MAYEAAVVQDLASELRTPESAAEWRDIIETLPGLHQMLAERYHALGEALSEQGGPSVQGTVAALHELAQAAGADAAEQVALAFSDEAAFWLGGD